MFVVELYLDLVGALVIKSMCFVWASLVVVNTSLDDRYYLRASPTAAGPQTGMGLPNWLRRRKSWSSEIPVFRMFDKITENTNFLRGFLKNPLIESVAGEHTQLFTEGFPVIFHEGLFSP